MLDFSHWWMAVQGAVGIYRITVVGCWKRREFQLSCFVGVRNSEFVCIEKKRFCAVGFTLGSQPVLINDLNIGFH